MSFKTEAVKEGPASYRLKEQWEMSCDIFAILSDECTRVYKSLDAVLDALRLENIATVERRLYPVASIKGCD